MRGFPLFHRPRSCRWLKRLLADIAAKQVEVVVVYKVDHLTRSLADFAKMVEAFDANAVSFVSVTQAALDVVVPHLRTKARLCL